MVSEEQGAKKNPRKKSGPKLIPDGEASANVLAKRRSRKRESGVFVPFLQRGRKRLPDDQVTADALAQRTRRQEKREKNGK